MLLQSRHQENRGFVVISEVYSVSNENINLIFLFTKSVYVRLIKIDYILWAFKLAYWYNRSKSQL